MDDNSNTSPTTNRTLDDATIIAAIKACRPFQHTDDLKRRVAAYLGGPDLNATFSGPGGFGYRVYCLNQDLEEREREEQITALGFQRATPELLQSLEGKAVEMLFGVSSGLGTSIRPGRIKANGRGGYLFLPRGNRTRGFWPTYVRLPGGPSGPEPTCPRLIVVHAGTGK